MNNYGSSQTFLAGIIIEELARLGIRDFICSPGARAIPLILALNSNEKIKKEDISYINDERSAAFFAQGSSKAGNLSVLICTSGTAVANYLPGVIEAYYSDTPLIIISTDRPSELHYGNANQTINQKNIFNDYTSLSIEISAIEKNVAVHSTLSNIDQLVRVAVKTKKPVHLNLCFRKPFYDSDFVPEKDLDKENFTIFNKWLKSNSSYTKDFQVDDNLEFKKNLNKKESKVLFIAGPLSNSSEINLISNISRENNIPVFSDIHSNLRQLNIKQNEESNILSLHNLYLKDIRELPEIIFYFGERIISDSVYKFLNSVDAKIIQISETPYRKDLIENEFIHFEEVISYKYFIENYSNLYNTKDYLSSFQSLENKAKIKLKEILDEEDSTERAIINSSISSMQEGSNIFLSASLIFREADSFCYDIPKNSHFFGNRGATGIDGIISSSLGTVNRNSSPLLCIIGDQAALHDLNALSLVKNQKSPVIILIINNDGGSIFHFMNKKELGTSLINPHGLNFENFSKGFNLKYKKTNSKKEVISIIKEAIISKDNKIVIEVIVDGSQSVEKFKNPI